MGKVEIVKPNITEEERKKVAKEINEVLSLIARSVKYPREM